MGPSTEPCGAPYLPSTGGDGMSLIKKYTACCLLHIDHGLKVDPPPPPPGYFCRPYFFLTLLCTTLLSGGLQIFHTWIRSPGVIEVWYPWPLGWYKNVSYTHCHWKGVELIFESMASTFIKSVRTQPMWTWWHGLVMSFTGELPQGHGKVISRSQQGQMSSKQLKIAFYVVFDKIMFTWDVFAGSKHSWTQTWTYAKIPPRGYRDNIRIGGFFTRREITLVSTLSDTAEMDQNNTLMLCFDQWPVCNNYTTWWSQVHMVTWVEVGCHRGVTPRSW